MSPLRPHLPARLPARLRGALVAGCATLALTACGSDQTATDPPTTGEDTVSEQPDDQPSDRPSKPPSEGPAGSAAARQAVADLVQRLEVDQAEVSVEAVEEVTWNDGSLGCAEQGTMYTQALVDGSRITLRVGEQSYEYHAGGSRAPFLCEKPTQ